MADNTSSNSLQTRGPVCLAVTAAMISISTVFVVCRLVSRIGIVRRMGLDDYFMILAWLLSFGLSFAICYGVSVGLGRHSSDIPPEWNVSLKKSEYVFTVLYNPSLMATKTSILVFYLTLGKEQQFFRWGTYTTLFVVTVAGIALTILNIVQCRPIGAAFKTPIPETAQCTDIVALFLSSAPVNLITDVAMLVLPMPILTSMRLPRKQKIILVITFGFGIFVAAVDIVRLAYLQEASKTHLRDIQSNSNPGGGNSRNDEEGDFPYYAALSFMWSAVEVNVGIMCACVPALKPLVTRFLPHILRDAGEVTEKAASDRTPTLNTADMNAMHRVPTIESPPASPGAPRKPLPSHANVEDGGAMDMMDFLTTPDMNELPDLGRTQTAMTNTTRHSRPPTFFDFVNIKRRKSLIEMTNKESYFPVAMVTILFFIWGFAYGLLDTLNAQFAAVAHFSTRQGVGNHSAYFVGYFFGPLTFGRLILKNWGFKACYIIGLVIYACGTLIFWPSAVLVSFPAFLVSNFVVGLGLSTLEIAANPFIALCGPAQYSEVRLNLSQGFQAIGTIVSPLLARKVLFRVEADSLIDVQWTYIGIAMVTFLLALAYYYVPLPELEDAPDSVISTKFHFPTTFRKSHKDGHPQNEPSSINIIWITLAIAVFSMFCYVGGQESVSTSLSQYLANVSPTQDPVTIQAVGHATFAVGRFLAAGANIFVKPRWVLLVSYLGAIAFAAAAMSIGTGRTPAAMIIMVYFFEGPIFSIVFAQAIRGFGRHTKDASALLTAAISGGAVFPGITYAVYSGRNPNSRPVQYALCVVIAAFAAGTLFPLYCCLFPGVAGQVDPKNSDGQHITTLPRHSPTLGPMGNNDDRRPSDSSSSSNHSSPGLGAKTKFQRIKFRRKKDSLTDNGRVEHRERRSWPDDKDHHPNEQIQSQAAGTGQALGLDLQDVGGLAGGGPQGPEREGTKVTDWQP